MMEDFSGLALPPLFGGHILEAELEPAGVELGPGEVTTLIPRPLVCSRYSCTYAITRVFPVVLTPANTLL